MLIIEVFDFSLMEMDVNNLVVLTRDCLTFVIILCKIVFFIQISVVTLFELLPSGDHESRLELKMDPFKYS